MSDSWDRPELTEAEQQAQRETRDRLVRAAMFAVDMFAIDHRLSTLGLAPAVTNRLLVESAVGSLLADGWITENDPTQDRWSRPLLPDHLRPDVMAELRRQR